MKKIAVVRGCTGCDTCRWLCPAQAITFDHKGAHVNPESCIGCGICIQNCASEAIHLESATISKGGKNESLQN